MTDQNSGAGGTESGKSAVPGADDDTAPLPGATPTVAAAQAAAPAPAAAPAAAPAVSPAPTAADGAAAVATGQQVPEVLRPPPKEPCLDADHLQVRGGLWWTVFLLFALVVVIKLLDREPTILDSLALAALGVSLATLFVECFTGDAGRRIRDMFVFAYAFTFGSFALLTLPFFADGGPGGPPEQRIKASSLELVRGCVRQGALGGLAEVSAVVICPPDIPDAAPAGAGATPPASAARWHKGEQTRYSLLLVIGGVTATIEQAPAVKPPVPPLPPASAASAAVTPGAEHWHVEVVGGLAVPFFVLVMSFIGGAVSLSRRIPEYQRRLDPAYSGTADQSRMRGFEAREAVVFQIMQLISAPFLAIATWYVVSPSTLASATTLAFGTGFASEPLLLMIRGLVNGIRPENSRFPPDAAQAVVSGTVQPPAGEDLPAPLLLELRAEGAETLLAQIAVAADGSFSSAPLTAGRYSLLPVAGARTFKPLVFDLPSQSLRDLKLQLEG